MRFSSRTNADQGTTDQGKKIDITYPCSLGEKPLLYEWLFPYIRYFYTMIFLKWNRLNRNCSGYVYHREIMNIASERPLKTVYATFLTFWVAAR